MSELSNYVKAFSSLHTNITKRYKAPHKAILLLSVIDLIEEGYIVSPRIALTDTLEDKFKALWSRYLGRSTVFKAHITKPFFHMQHEDFWWLIEKGPSTMMVADVAPFSQKNKEKKELPKGGYSVKAMRKAFAYAEIDEELFVLLQNMDARAMLRVVLINTYLSNQPTKTMPNIGSLIVTLPLLALVA
jgi:putative restriction endonuclease